MALYSATFGDAMIIVSVATVGTQKQSDNNTSNDIDNDSFSSNSRNTHKTMIMSTIISIAMVGTQKQQQ